MSKLRENAFIKKVIKYREYAPPVLHLEMLNERELDIAFQIVKIFEEAGVAFACILRNEIRKDELNIHIYGFISKKEKKQIFAEVKEMYADSIVFTKIDIG